MGLVGQIVDGEGEFVHAGAVGVIAQLGLDLAVGLAVHQNVGIGGGGQIGPCQTGALLQQGVVEAAGVFLTHGNGGGHQQAVGQIPGRDVLLSLQAPFPDILGHQRDHTGDGGGSHGGAGHELILIRAAAVAHGLTVQGVDIAAGSGDLGLQSQAAGHAPGAEAAHGVVLGVAGDALVTAADGDLAGVVGDAAGGGVLLGGAADDIGIALGNGNTGAGVGVARQIHAEVAGLVVVHDGGNGAEGNGVVCLDGKVQVAPGAEDDLTLQIHAPVVLGIAQTVDEHEVILGAGEVDGGIQGGQGQIAAVLRVCVHGEMALSPDGQANAAVIFHGGHGEEAVVGAGGAYGIQIRIVGVEITEGGGIRPGAGVAGGGDHNRVGLGDVFQQLAVVVVEAVAGHGGAQGQVHGITA